MVKSLDIWLAALREPLARRGYTFSDTEIGANFAIFRERMRGKIDDVDTIVAEAIQITNQRMPDVELYPDAVETLSYLRARDKRIALVTTSSHEQVDPLLTKYGIAYLFNAVVCCDDVLNGKPHAEPLEKALKTLHGNRQQAIMIGDSGTDIAAANNAAIDSALFCPPAHKTFYDIRQLKQLGPTYIIEDFKQIMKFT